MEKTTPVHFFSLLFRTNRMPACVGAQTILQDACQPLAQAQSGKQLQRVLSARQSGACAHQQVVTPLYTTLPIASVAATERSYSSDMPARLAGAIERSFT
ncbi:MAG TPA: hypothetical protein VN019_08005, partial [Oxalicibacterium sp.]|nr:hypothetical protein [Oxalicibacterium sp.]